MNMAKYNMNEYLPPNFNPDDDIATCAEEEAGLLFAGYDEDGQKEWLGDKAAWERLDKLQKEEEIL